MIDLYFTDPSLKNIKIIDFAPLDEKETCSILFDWSELKDIKKENSPKLKLIRSEDDCRLGFMRLNAIPIDWEQFMKPDTIPKF